MQVTNYIVFDAESFFEKKVYDLKSMGITRYVRDPRFKLHGYAAGPIDGPINWFEPMEVEGRNDLPDLLDIDWTKTALVGHNIKFDGAILAWLYDIHPALYIDTIALSRSMLGELVPGHDLATVAAYLKLGEKGKELAELNGKRDLAAAETEKLADYCINDAKLAAGIFKELWPRFPKSQAEHMDWTIRAFVEPILELDVPHLERMVKNEKARRDQIIAASTIDRRVLSSNKQFSAFLTSRGISCPTKRSPRTGKQIPALGIQDRGFREIRAADSALADARVAAKSTLLETRGATLIKVGLTGKFPFDGNFSGATQTHRDSGGSNAGGNPYNFPRESPIKESICAPRGSKILLGDFSNIELRFNAWMAKEKWLMDALAAGKDIYSMFASKEYGREITKADKKERQFGKTCELGLGYCMGAEKFRDRVYLEVGEDIDLPRAKNTVNLYRDTHPAIVDNWGNAEKLLPLMRAGTNCSVWFAPCLKVSKNAITLPSGLQLKYPNLRAVKPADGKHGWKWQYVYDVYYKKHETTPDKLYGGKIIENICQALTRELCVEAMHELRAAGIRSVMQVYDEIVTVVADKDVERARRLMAYHMSRAPKWMPDLAVRAEIGVGQNWAEAKHDCK